MASISLKDFKCQLEIVCLAILKEPELNYICPLMFAEFSNTRLSEAKGKHFHNMSYMNPSQFLFG